MSVDNIAADVATAAASLAGQDAARAEQDTPSAGEQTAEALHGREPGADQHDSHGRGRDELGRYTPKTPAKEKVELVDPAKKAVQPEKPAEAPIAKLDAAKAPEAPAVAPEKPTEVTKPTEPPLVAPRSWRPAAREKWASLPREVQVEALRVDREAQNAMTKTMKEREYAGKIREVLQPYEHMLRAENLDAPRAIGDLLRTAAALRTAAPVQKAALVANMVTQFGVPIEALADALDRQGPTRPIGSIAMEAPSQYQPPAPQFPAQVFQDPRVDQLLAEREAAAKAEADRQQTEISTFGQTHEFFEDVRQEMADELDRAKARGRSLTLEQAYGRALSWHKADPDSELGTVLRQRDEAAAAKAQLAQSQQARAAAAVSVKAEPAPVAVPTTKGTALDDVRAAFARLSQ